MDLLLRRFYVYGHLRLVSLVVILWKPIFLPLKAKFPSICYNFHHAIFWHTIFGKGLARKKSHFSRIAREIGILRTIFPSRLRPPSNRYTLSTPSPPKMGLGFGNTNDCWKFLFPTHQHYLFSFLCCCFWGPFPSGRDFFRSDRCWCHLPKPRTLLYITFTQPPRAKWIPVKMRETHSLAITVSGPLPGRNLLLSSSA